MKPQLIALVGPTSSGKTQWAIRLADQLGGCVVSADSRQVYAGMNIGTGKPRQAWRRDAHTATTAEAVDDILHYLLNISTPDNALMLADWQQAAFGVIDEAVASGPVLLTGGTMLYVDSIVKNYDVPAVSPSPQLRAALKQRSTEELYRGLLEQDPAARSFIEPHHTRRIIRALEVIAATGRPFSEQRRERPPRYATVVVGLAPSWEYLEERIRERAAAMLDDGLLDETRALRQQYGTSNPLLRTINYAQAQRVLQNEITEAAALKEMTRAMLRYARRQMAWWKRNPAISWFDPARVTLDEIVETALAD